MGPSAFPQTLNLKDASEAVLVPLLPGEMKDLQAFYCSLPEEERTALKDDVTTPEWAATFHAKLETGEILSLVAKIDGAIVGEGTLYRTFRGWTRHVGEIRIATHHECRRKGLGTALAGTLVGIATDLGIEKIIVQVVENQTGARRTFEKLGFHKEAVLARHVMDLSDVKRDLLIMANDVTRIWAALESIGRGEIS